MSTIPAPNTPAYHQWFMENPIEWPHWPWLPIKRRKPEGGWPDAGLLFASAKGGDPVTFLPMNLWDLVDLSKDELSQRVETADTKTPAELVSAGWEVD